MDRILEYIKSFPIEKAIGTACLIAICLLIIKIAMILVDKLLGKSKMDILACKIVRIIVKSFLLFTAVMIVLSSLGISVTSFIAAFSVISLWQFRISLATCSAVSRSSPTSPLRQATTLKPQELQAPCARLGSSTQSWIHPTKS